MIAWIKRWFRVTAWDDATKEGNHFVRVADGAYCLLAGDWPVDSRAVPPWATLCQWATWDEYCDAYDGYTEKRDDCLHGTDLLFTAPWQEYTDKYRLMIDAIWDPDRGRWMLLRKADTLVSYTERLRQPKRHAWMTGIERGDSGDE